MSELAFVLSNLSIFSGYLFIALVLVPNYRVRFWYTKLGGFLFFLTCGFTHLELAVHAWFDGGLPLPEMTSWHMMGVHVVQAAAVWMFVVGLYVEFVRPQLRRREAT